MKSRLTWFVIIAMIAGPLCGLLLQQTLGTGPAADSVAAGLSLVTTSFLRLIKMIIAPLVFSTLVVGVARMEGAASIARIRARALGWFVVATMRGIEDFWMRFGTAGDVTLATDICTYQSANDQ